MRLPPESDGRRRLGELIEERRLDLRLRLRDLADVSGLSTETLRQIKAGSGGLRPLTKRALEEALRWAPGSVDAILAGGDPAEARRDRRDEDVDQQLRELARLAGPDFVAEFERSMKRWGPAARRSILATMLSALAEASAVAGVDVDPRGGERPAAGA